ncbi:MAG: GC-type dockerin domain-anchored protein, partial [Phycisphaerales bacterium]
AIANRDSDSTSVLLNECAEEACLADFNGDGSLNVLDFVAFQLAFTAGDAAADCDENGLFDVLDFVCFQQEFVVGCP